MNSAALGTSLTLRVSFETAWWSRTLKCAAQLFVQSVLALNHRAQQLGATVAPKHPGCFEQPGCCPEFAHGDLASAAEASSAHVCRVGAKVASVVEERRLMARLPNGACGFDNRPFDPPHVVLQTVDGVVLSLVGRSESLLGSNAAIVVQGIVASRLRQKEIRAGRGPLVPLEGGRLDGSLAATRLRRADEAARRSQ